MKLLYGDTLLLAHSGVVTLQYHAQTQTVTALNKVFTLNSANKQFK